MPAIREIGFGLKLLDLHLHAQMLVTRVAQHSADRRAGDEGALELHLEPGAEFLHVGDGAPDARARDALSKTFFSMRSVLDMMCNLLVADVPDRKAMCNQIVARIVARPFSAMARAPATLRPMLRKVVPSLDVPESDPRSVGPVASAPRRTPDLHPPDRRGRAVHRHDRRAGRRAVGPVAPRSPSRSARGAQPPVASTPLRSPTWPS